MVFLVVAEALAPSGSLPGPLELRRVLRGRLSRASRYSQISRIAVRHGLGPYLRGRRRAELQTPEGRQRLAGSVRQALEEAGVTFVKLGQVLSTRPDLLPAEVVEELGHLQDDVAPAPWDQVAQVLAAELDGPVEEVFAAFDRRPLAAASVAQVHAARLRSGAEVAVKVQRPGIRAVVERDLDIEAANMAAVAAAADGTVEIPVPHRPLCGRRVLVMQRLEGTPLTEAGPALAERGLDQERLERDLGQFMARYLTPGAGAGVAMFGDLFRIVSAYGLSVPPEVAAVFRALATLEGTLTLLSPGFDLVAEARAFATRDGGVRLDPAAGRQLVAEELMTLLPMLRRLTRRAERIASAAEHGRLSIHVRLFADQRDRQHLTGLLHQVLLTILAATAGIMAVLLLGTPDGPAVTATVSLYELLGYNLLVVCAILALRVLVLIFRPDRSG
jgi:predicted unusual protein kinase regulating ubiquinone biosynthesis (AarF/ABC1/UbiB family)